MRALRLPLAVVAFTACVVAPTVAAAKPGVAVLGLEVVEDGAVDPRTTAVARSLTKELRDEASKSEGKFERVPDSNKDLLELKLLSDCSDEGRRCMADIGKELKADFLLYGKVERKKNGFQVSLKLLDTATAQMAKTTSDVVPLDADSAALAGMARAFYGRLTGAPEQGGLLVRANVEAGSVYVDGELKVSLAGGTAKVGNLAEGVHRVTIEAAGHKRYDAEVAIAAGREEELVVSLEADEVPTDDGDDGGERPGGGWRTAFWISAGATAIGATAWTVEAYRYAGLWVTTGPYEQDKIDAVEALNAEIVRDPNFSADDQFTYEENACDDAKGLVDSANPDIASAANRLIRRCDRGQFHANMTLAAGIGTGVAAAAAAYFYYKGYVAPGRSSVERQARRGATRRSALVVAPTITPTTVGAGLAIEF